MKLISCYIKGYGALKDKNVIFDGSVTELIQSNGIGKTTLASFLKAMLYGMENVRANGSEFRDREHFYPFDSGSFGGTLTLEHQGNTYRVERTFDVKSDKKDTFTVYKDGVETNELSGKPLGVTLLGVDKESFERTLFITADDVDISATDSIKNKLGNAVQGDETGYEKADTLLEKAVKSYKPERKTQNNDAYIPKTEEDIYKLKTQISNVESIQGALEKKYEDECKLKAEIAQKEEGLKITRNTETRKAQTARYTQLKDEIEQAKNAKTELESRYPEGLPSATEIEEIKDLQKRRDNTESQSTVDTFTADDRIALSELKERFKNGIPTKNELENAQNLLNEYTSLKTQYDGIAPEIHTGSKQMRTASPLPYIVAAVFGTLIAIVGVVLLTLNTTTPGAILTAFGAVILAVSGFLYLNKKTTYIDCGITSAENPERIRVRSEIQEKEDSLKKILKPYGNCSEHGLAYDFGKLEADLDKYSSLKKRESTSISQQDESRRALEEIDTSLKAIAEKYAIEELNTDRLRDDLKELNRLNSDISTKSQTAENYRIEHGIIEEIEAELTVNGIDIEAEEKNVNELRQALTALQAQIVKDESEAEKLDGYRSELDELNERLQEYEKTHKLLSAAKDFLKEASDTMNHRYVEPVMRELQTNSDALSAAIGRPITVNRDFELLFEEDGALRKEKHLSSGQRALCSLCFRISLIKNVYRDTVPFIIMDDPFVNLDEANMDRARAIVKSLAEEMQVIYFTCHNSRALSVANG